MQIDGPSGPGPTGTPATGSEDRAVDPNAPAAGPTMPDAPTMEAVWALVLQNAMSLGEEAVKQAQEAEKDDEDFY